MAQHSSPSRRIPGDPLAGVLRTVAFQARYSNRRRTDVPTITSATGRAASAAAATDVAALIATSVAGSSPAETGPDAVVRAATLSELEEQPAATYVATLSELPRDDAATLMTGGDGCATWQYGDRGTVPCVVASVTGAQPAVATVGAVTATSAVMHVWGLDGRPLSGAFVSVIALWP